MTKVNLPIWHQKQILRIAPLACQFHGQTMTEMVIWISMFQICFPRREIELQIKNNLKIPLNNRYANDSGDLREEIRS